MNKDRRKRLEEARILLAGCTEAFSQALEIIQEVKDEEEEAYENLPESLQNSDRGSVIQEAIGSMDSAIDALDSCDLESVMGDIESAVSA